MSERLLLEVIGSGRPGTPLPPVGTLTVGCDVQRCALVVSAPGVADVHCAIGRAKGGGWAVKDLGSVAGTRVNGARVEAARLRAGDELLLGDARLRVVDPARPAAAGPRPDETQTLSAGDLEPELAQARVESPADSAARAAPLPSVAGYRVEQRLGRGGMGDVYLAVQTSLDRKVALKVLSPRFAQDAEFVRRFQAEARAAAALNHPNVVTVYDVGEDRGTHYLSMEYMERGTLEDRVAKSGALPVDEVLAILRDAAAGLVYAEARKIVHRDLKPANLMQNHVGQTKIADLGLATHVEAEETQTADRKVFGTPHFMSPEQARGERVDQRSDLYSLGATAYRLLTGHTPFEGKDAKEIVRALLRDDPRPMREFRPDLPDGVVALVERLMKKDAAARFGSAQEVLREVEQLRVHAGAAAPAAPKRRSTAPIALLLLAAAAAGGWWYFAGRGPSAPPAGAGRSTAAQRGAVQPVAQAPAAGPAESSKPAPPVKPKPPKEKDDKELQLFEAQAKVALLELMQRELAPNDRRDELRLLAQRYQGTGAATEALQKADAISAQLDAAARADTVRKAQVEETIGKLRAAARLDATPPEPGKSFLAMRTVPGQADLAQDAEFVTRRKEIENLVVGRAVQHARETMAAANRDLERGDFDAGKARLAALLPVFDLPEFPIGQAPAGMDDLFEVGRQARERFHNLEQLRGAYERKRSRDDALAVASTLGGPSGLEKELLALDMPAARERALKLAERVNGAPEQAFARALAADCAAAQAVVETLGREFAGWRRRSFTDPRDRKNTTRNAVGADAQGILYEAEPGRPERVPWSAFGGSVQGLTRLFFERLQREYTPAEVAGVAALARLTAVTEAVQVASKMLEPGRKANFTEGNARDLQALFEQAQPWADKAGDEARARLAREAEAAGVLCGALRAATETRWASAAAAVERLLTEYADTLLVRLCSDGRPLQELSNG
jgi:tRNA A-37 threonylcarbamoyl transferase component Bud32